MGKKTARLFILSGQSNAGGNGNGDLLSSEDAALDPEVLIYRGNMGEVAASRSFESMAPGTLKKPKTKFEIERLIFGPELSFAKEIKKAYPADIIAVAKVAVRGGTSILAWEKDHSRPGWRDELRNVGNENAVFLEDGQIRHMYQELIDDTKHAVELLKAREDVSDVVVCGMVWVQNENDGKREESARNYRRNLKALIENVRADLGVPQMPFLFMGVHQEEPAETRALLQQGLVEITSEVPNTALIPSKDVEKFPENVHFNTAGILDLGRRFSSAYLSMVNAQPAIVESTGAENAKK